MSDPKTKASNAFVTTMAEHSTSMSLYYGNIFLYPQQHTGMYLYKSIFFVLPDSHIQFSYYFCTVQILGDDESSGIRKEITTVNNQAAQLAFFTDLKIINFTAFQPQDLALT